jgi:alpha-D-xyloside xylohydrolase
VKFSNGAWLWADNVTPHCMQRLDGHEIADAGNTLLCCAVDRRGNDGSDRFEGTVLQLRVSSPMPDCVRVQVRHHHPTAPNGRESSRFDLDYELKSPSVRIDESNDELRFASGKLALVIRKGPPWEMRFEDTADSARVTGAGRHGLGYIRVRGVGDFLSQRLSLGVGECIYGLGERFGPIVRNGQTVTIWNEDGGTVSDQAYKNIPFYLSSRGYGLLVNTPGKVEFEIATERVSDLQFSVQEEELDYYVFLGPDPKDVLEKYTRLSGRPAMPPAWSFGLWLSTSFTTSYDEQTVTKFVDGMAERKIPLSVFHFDCFWMRQRHWCDFEWDPKAFPDPRGMLQRLTSRGLRVCLWINPYISQLSKLFDEGRRNGYFLKRADGSVYQIDGWQPGMAFVDFTNPVAVDWYTGKLRALLEMGVDAFKTDFGERIPADAVYHDGSDPKLMHNYYPYLYNQAVFKLLEEHHGEGNAIVFARSGTAGSQKFPVHWGGDCEATFESMAEDLRGGLSFCASGAAFWSHDIGGFTGKADPALYKRWVTFGLLSTHSRLHGSESYRVPWIFDEESVDVMRRFARLKNRLFPYLYAAARDAHERGWPVMRPMHIEFPDDPACRYLDRQYMLGTSLLVAPVFRHDNVAEFFLPTGKWTNLLDGRVIGGGRWQQETIDFMHVPLWVRENSIVPMSSNEERPEWSPADELTLNVFAVHDNADITAHAASSESSERGVATFRCRRGDGRITIENTAANAKRVRVLLRSARNIGAITNGKLLREQPEGLLIDWTDTAKPISVPLKD